DVLVVESDRPLGGALEARDHPQDRRLAAARRPQERDELAAADVEVDVVDGHDVTSEALDEAAQADAGRAATGRGVAGAGRARRHGAVPRRRPTASPLSLTA